MSERRPRGRTPLHAQDELRFGAERTLNLRESLPTAAQAVRRAENFLREHQVRRSTEVLIITGRGSRSPDGVPVIRDAVEHLLFSLRRRGVVSAHHQHNPGSFAVELAPIRNLVEAIPRQRDRRPRPADPVIAGLSDESNALLRALAEHALDAIGVRQDAGTIENEMHRQLRAIAPGLPGGDQMEPALQHALRAAIEEYD